MTSSPAFSVVKPEELTAYKISPDDTVRLAILSSPDDGWDATVVFEIWEPDGSQPWNSHPVSTETFLFLQGSGIAYSDDESGPISAGRMLVLPAGSSHRIHNTSPGRLYAITTMSPDDGFADLIRRGTPVALEPRDLAVLGAIGLGGAQGAAQPTDVKHLLDRRQVGEALQALPGWVGDNVCLEMIVNAPDFPTAMQLVQEVGHLGEELGHHADVDMRWCAITMRLSSHTHGGVLPIDLVMAERVSEICSRLGISGSVAS